MTSRNAISFDYSRSVYFDWQSNACNERWRLSSDLGSMKYRLFFFAVGNSKREIFAERFTTTWYSMIQCKMKTFIVVNDIEVSRERLFDLHAPIIWVFWTSGEWWREECTLQYLLLISGHHIIRKIISLIFFITLSSN